MYDCTIDTTPPRSSTYFVAILSCLPILTVQSVPFENSSMGRELLMAEVALDDKRSLLVATAHLESLKPFVKQRVAQLKQSFEILSKKVENESQFVGALFMGDTNLVDDNEIRQLDPRLHPITCLNLQVAPSGRAQCRLCKTSIAKQTVRLGEEVEMLNRDQRRQDTTHWFHLTCFAQKRGLGDVPAKRLSGFEYLTSNQKAFVETTFAKTGLNGSEYEYFNQQPLRSAGLPDGWIDLWLDHVETSPSAVEIAESYTFDGQKNTLISNRGYRSRLDRMYFCSRKDAEMRSPRQTFERIGLEPIAPDLCHPSDHFGLHCAMTIPFDLDKAEEARLRQLKERKRMREVIEID